MKLLVLFALANAIFWSFASHSQHCDLANKLMPNMTCPDHSVHLMMGIAFFIAATYFHNKSYVDTLM